MCLILHGVWFKGVYYRLWSWNLSEWSPNDAYRRRFHKKKLAEQRETQDVFRQCLESLRTHVDLLCHNAQSPSQEELDT